MTYEIATPDRAALEAFIKDPRTLLAFETLFDDFAALKADAVTVLQNEIATQTVASKTAFTLIGTALPLAVASLRQGSVIRCSFSGRIGVHGGDTFTLQLLVGGAAGVAVGGSAGANGLGAGDIASAYIVGDLRSTVRDAVLDAATAMQGGGSLVCQTVAGTNHAILFGADPLGSADLSADTSVGLFIKWSSANAANTIDITDLSWEIGAP